MTLFDRLCDLRVPPFGADRDLDVVEKKILKRQPMPGLQQSILDRHKAATVEVHGDDRFAKPLLPFPLDAFRIGSGTRLVKTGHHMPHGASGRAVAAFILLAAAARTSFVAAGPFP